MFPAASAKYDAAAIAGSANAPDWFPDEHPPAPRVVTGPMPNACGSCHLMSGQSHPESADIAGLPAEYIIRQMNDFRSGARNEENRMGPIARATFDADIQLAAEYFAAITPIPFVKVIETDRLETAERELAMLKAAQARPRATVQQVMPRLVDEYRALVDDLAGSPAARARAEIRKLVGDIQVNATPDEIRLEASDGALDAALVRAAGGNQVDGSGGRIWSLLDEDDSRPALPSQEMTFSIRGRPHPRTGRSLLESRPYS